jgi:hypothetical protein
MATPAETSSGTPATEVLRVRVLFASRFQAFVEAPSPEGDPVGHERDLIQLFTLAWVKLLFLLGENRQAPLLLGYFQTAMGDTVTPKGLARPTIMSGEQRLLEAAPEKVERTVTLRLLQEDEARLAELELPPGDEGHLYPACAVFLLQYLIRRLGDPSLFFLMLVLGGVMEYYGESGKTNDLRALTAAPEHGFATALRYIEEERRRAPGGTA